ncbi:MAG TPA: pilus assembly protein TadG-related protein [Rhizomicrobium sp.]|jgi:hypothetical protein
MVIGRLSGFLSGEGANISPLFALLLIPLIGAMSLASETSSWLLVKRAMQNAADSAVLAAAANGVTAGCTSNCNTTWNAEALSVSANYGFANGANHTTVTAVNNATCPASTSSGNCYQVTITRTVPLYLIDVVGFTGNATIGGTNAEQIAATAMASAKSVPTTYCVLALSTGSGSYGVNGGNSINFNGCDVRSNGATTCNGANSSGGAGQIIYTTTNKKCTNGDGSAAIKASGPLADPYTGRASSVPANTCTPPTAKATYPQEPTLPATNLLVGTLTWPATKILCGDVKLTGDVNLTTASPGTTLVIENGQLDLNTHTLQTSSGSGLTIVFTGPSVSGLSPMQYPTGGGALNIAAPTSGAWSGVAIYQDLLYSNSNSTTIANAGSTPTWNITGLVYFPTSNLTFNGAVNKANNGVSCFSLVGLTVMASGTGDIFAGSQSQCAQAGLTPPSDGSAQRQVLVD